MVSRSQHKRSSVPAYVLWVFLIILATSCIVGAALSSGGLQRAWTLATTHQPERYTQLFFENPGHLPQYAPARKPQTIYFHIVNHESQAQVYTYQVHVTANGITTVHSSSVYLRDGGNARLAIAFTIAKPASLADITVKLMGRTEQLTFRSRS